MPSAAKRRPRRPPTRTCVVCRTSGPKAGLLRVVRLTEGRVVVDPGGRQPGRGAYVCDDPICRRMAISKGSLARALRTTVPPDLAANLGLAVPDPIPTLTEGGARGQE